MLTSPWTATVLRQHTTVLNTILSELALAKATGGLVPSGNAVFFVTPLAERIPAFTMPVTSVEYASRKLDDGGWVFMDARSFMRRDRNSGSGTVMANQFQADFWQRMGDLTALWVKEPTLREDFLRVGDLPAMTYISWLSQSIAQKLGLDMEVAREVQIVTAVYYAHHFFEADEALSEKGKAKILKLVSRWTRAPIPLIEQVGSDLPYMTLLDDYIKALHTHFAHNTRISQINVGFLIMTLGRSWFGYGAQEISAVALEYPPIYLALIEAACNNKVWRKTHLGKLVERFAIGRVAQEFGRSMEVLAGQVHKASLENLDVSMEDAKAPFKNAEWKHGWSQQEKITWWGEHPITIKVTAQATKDETVSKVQVEAYRDFDRKIEGIIKSKKKDMIAYIQTHYKKRYTEDELVKNATPSGVVFTRNGEWGILFDLKVNAEDGLALYTKGQSVIVGEQDQFL